MDTYENKYKEAKKWIESIYSELSHEQQTEAEAFFPELKESEDEKIRKALLELVHDTTGDELWVDYNVHKEDALAWLEKQGEQKPTNEEMIEALRTEYEKGRADAIAEMQVAWSEEDERICRAIVADIANDKSICKFEISKSICDEQINWLKSLKNRITWKPSEQQMNAIKIAIAYMTDECETPTAPKVLCELLEQLKKLTE